MGKNLRLNPFLACAGIRSPFTVPAEGIKEVGRLPISVLVALPGPAVGSKARKGHRAALLAKDLLIRA